MDLSGYDNWKLRAPEDEPGYCSDEPDHYCDESECPICNACMRCEPHLPSCANRSAPVPPPLPAVVAAEEDIQF